MALTKISTDGVKDDAITKAKIPADQIEASELANDAVDTNAIQDDAVTEDKLANSINSAIAANTAKDLTALSASNLTSGTVPDARISASSVTQHVTAFDDNNIINDISALALKLNALQNATRYNTNSMSIETFEDSNGIASLVTVQRNADGEYLSSLVTTTTNVTEGFKGGQNNNTGAEASYSNSGAQSYTGYDGVNRVAGQLGNPASYNSFNLGKIFDAGENFDIFFQEEIFFYFQLVQG